MHTAEIQTIHRFYARALDNFRSLYIYLPPSYSLEPERRFPVLYMQDGQNIFDGSGSYSGEGWEIDRAATALIQRGLMEEIVIVGIAHQHEERLSEYAHEDGRFQGQRVRGRGALYEAFLLEDVMPFIEANYRVLTGPEHTALMGSSMGGLVTFRIGLRHPGVFGKLGVVSPSFWWNDCSTVKLVRALKRQSLPGRLWLDMGSAEGDFGHGFREVAAALYRQGMVPLKEMACLYMPDGLHSEPDWKARVHCPLLYFFGEIGTPEHLELHGRDVVGLIGPRTGILPLVRFSTGFMVTPLPDSIRSSRPEILTAGRDGTLQPHGTGEANLTLHWGELSASRSYVVTDQLSETVSIRILVQAPEAYEGPLFMGAADPQDVMLQRVGQHYEAALELPRDTVFSFKFTQGSWGTVECDAQGEPHGGRRIRAVEDSSFHFTIDRWQS